MKNLVFIVLFLPFLMHAQVVMQKGHIRKINYSKNSVHVPLQDVRVKVETEERSDAKGDVILKISANPENTFVITDIYKMGYSLISPNVSELNVKKYAMNSKTTIEIVLVDNNEQRMERMRIENNIRKKNEMEIADYRTKMETKDAELAKYKENDLNYKNLQHERDSIATLLRTFSQSYYEADKAILDEAEKLSRIDYGVLDSIQQKNIELRKEGKGKELVETNRLTETEEQNARKLSDEIQKGQNAINAKKTELEQLELRVASNAKLRDYYAQRYKDMADGYRMQYKNDSVLICLKNRMGLDPDNESYLLDYASFLKHTAKYQEAQSNYMTALKISIEKNGPQSIETANIYYKISEVCMEQGDYQKSLEYGYNAIENLEIVFGEKHPEVANSYNNIGSIYSKAGDYPKAWECYNKALAIHKLSLETATLDEANVYNNIGLMYTIQNEYTMALDYHKKALEIQEKVLGIENLDVADTYNNIGGVFNNLGDETNALEFLQKALEIRQQVLGTKHPKVATSYNNIGGVYFNKRNFPKILEYFSKSLMIMENVLGKEHPDVAVIYHNMGVICSAQGDYLSSLEWENKALEIRKKVFGSENASTASSYSSIGTIYLYLENHAKAIEYLNEALRIDLEIFGNDHTSTATIYNSIGGVHENEGDYVKALEYYSKALEILKKILGNNHLTVARSYSNIGDVYVQLEDFTNALENYLKTLDIRIEGLGNDHVDVATSFNKIGDVYYYKGEYTVALDYYNKALVIREKQLGRENRKTKSVLDNIKRTQLLMMPNHIFMVEVTEDGSARQLGLLGKYIVLYYEGWEIGDTGNLILHQSSLKDKPKRIILMNDKGIQEYNFGTEFMGLNLDIEEVSPERAAEVLNLYMDWKK